MMSGGEGRHRRSASLVEKDGWGGRAWCRGKNWNHKINDGERRSIYDHHSIIKIKQMKMWGK